jgi:hypothetical protein
MIISLLLPVNMSTRLMRIIFYTVKTIVTLGLLSHLCMVLTLVLCTYDTVITYIRNTQYICNMVVPFA